MNKLLHCKSDSNGFIRISNNGFISRANAVQLLQETISFAYEQKERQEDLKTSVEAPIHPNSSAGFKVMEKEGAVGVLGPAGALVRQHNDVLIVLNPKTEEKLLLSRRGCLQFKLCYIREFCRHFCVGNISSFQCENCSETMR